MSLVETDGGGFALLPGDYRPAHAEPLLAGYTGHTQPCCWRVHAPGAACDTGSLPAQPVLRVPAVRVQTTQVLPAPWTLPDEPRTADGTLIGGFFLNPDDEHTPAPPEPEPGPVGPPALCHAELPGGGQCMFGLHHRGTCLPIPPGRRAAQ